MELSLQVAAGVVLLTGTAVLVHFFYVALRAPEDMSLGLTDQRFPASWGGRAYLGLVVLSWVAFAFSGAYGLLTWLPGEEAVILASLVAFLSIGLLIHLERSAHIVHRNRRTMKVRSELEQLIQYAIIPSQGTIDNFQEKAKSAESVADREAYAELAGIASVLSERDKKLCEYAVSQAQREATERVEEQERVDKEAKAQAEKRELRIKLQETLNAATQPLPIVKTIVSTIAGEAIVEPTVAKQKWQSLNDFGERLRHLGEDAPIQTLLQAVEGTKPIEEANFKLEFVGNERDGHYEAVCFHGGAKGQLADGLSFESSLDGLIAAFFLRAALPGRLAWGHGFYDSDQEFIFAQERAVAILENDRVPPDSEGLKAIKVPAGLRFSRTEDGTITLRCLTYRPGKGFYDFAVSITGVQATPVQEIKLYQWGRGIFY